MGSWEYYPQQIPSPVPLITTEHDLKGDFHQIVPLHRIFKKGLKSYPNLHKWRKTYINLKEKKYIYIFNKIFLKW